MGKNVKFQIIYIEPHNRTNEILRNLLMASHLGGFSMSERSSRSGNGKREPENEVNWLPEKPDFVVFDSNKASLEDAVKQILVAVGENPAREGLERTPERVAKMYGELLDGYTQDLDTVVNNALFDVEYGQGEMVVVADIDFNSLCEHHMLPFTGKAHVAY